MGCRRGVTVGIVARAHSLEDASMECRTHLSALATFGLLRASDLIGRVEGGEDCHGIAHSAPAR
jgi:hypothetical protein